ncbi:OmpA family protein [Campylobacter sp.]|uniref:OmpA family protein n=1 Tax=Campylobacter sp. TaxID=205 RepID=UPI0026FC6504|nr:OmpA family protein [Campylobacter sp.]
MKIEDKRQSSDQTFWISYADLMAGLMFVFMLIIGAVVVKYVLTQSDITQLQLNLRAQEQNLTIAQKELRNKEALIQNIFSNLNTAKLENQELAEINELINERLRKARDEKSRLENITSAYANELDDANKTIENLDLQVKELITSLSSKERQVSELLASLEAQGLRYENLEKDYNDTKMQIKNLGLLHSNVISNLRTKLGDKVHIDPASGVVALPNSILFDIGSHTLKEESKEKLKEILQSYFDAVLNNNEIRKHIDKIVIEGHTDSVGSYLYNLDLSQKRAYEVLEFIYSWNKDKRLEKYLIASGRSFSDLIVKNGKEDAEASRRIEIKISISDKEAMKEIEEFLERQNKKY